MWKEVGVALFVVRSGHWPVGTEDNCGNLHRLVCLRGDTVINWSNLTLGGSRYGALSWNECMNE
jgi:hypothetical protein